MLRQTLKGQCCVGRKSLRNSKTSSDEDELCNNIEEIGMNGDKAPIVVYKEREHGISESIYKLRRKAIWNGLKSNEERSLCWSLFLGIGEISASDYYNLIRRGPCRADIQIRDDVRRTFRSDKFFSQGKRDAEMRRILTALRHDRNEDCEEKLGSAGANRCGLSAAFLAALPSELDAFYSLKVLACLHCPTYFTPTLVGATNGSALVSACIQIIDPHFYALLLRAASCHLSYQHHHIKKNKLNGQTSIELDDDDKWNDSIEDVDTVRSISHRIMYTTKEYYEQKIQCRARSATTQIDHSLFDDERASLFEDLCAFPLLASFLTCAPPLNEVLRLWDLLFALGPHRIVILVTAIFLDRKDAVIHAADPLRLLQPRSLPKIDASSIVKRVMNILPLIPPKLHDLIFRHATVSLDRATLRRSCFELLASSSSLLRTTCSNDHLFIKATAATTTTNKKHIIKKITNKEGSALFPSTVPRVHLSKEEITFPSSPPSAVAEFLIESSSSTSASVAPSS